MKKTLIIGALFVGSVTAYSQGTILFADNKTDMTIHVFSPQLDDPSQETTGNQGGAAGVSADIYNNGTTIITGGSTVYTGGAIGNTIAGNATAAGAYNYNVGIDYTAQLYAAPGLNAAASSLVPVTQYSAIMYTSSVDGGEFHPVAASPSDPGVPGVLAGGSATVALVVWYNGGGATAATPLGGLYGTYAEAVAAGVPHGESLLANIGVTGGSGSPPANPVDLEGLQSFSLVTTPEPSTIALGVIGASAFLFRRRK